MESIRDADGFFGLAEAAAFLNISERNLRGKLPPSMFFKLGGRSLVNKVELREWAEQFRQAPAGRDLNSLVDEVVADVLGRRPK